jgi:rubrerythrin
MKRKKPKKTREELAAMEARHEDIQRRLLEMIERYRVRIAERQGRDAEAS